MARISIDGIEPIVKKLEALEGGKALRVGMYQAGEHVLKVAKKYPPKLRPSRKSVYGMTWVSDRQRRFMMWAMRNPGKSGIDVPYRRSQSPTSKRFGQQWSHVWNPNGLTHDIGNGVKAYGAYLMDPKKQSLYMKAVGWKTTQQIADAERNRCVRIVTNALMEALKG
jgi:hypothetical protein